MKRGELRISIFVVGMQKWFYELFFVDTSWMGSMPAKPVDFKLRNVRRGIRAASQENLIVSEVEIGPDGTIHIHTTPPGEKSHDTELDKWLGEHPNAGQAQGYQ